MFTRSGDLTTRLFFQAGLTALFAPLNTSGGWMLLAFVLAATAAGLGAALVKDALPQPRNVVLGFEAVAILFGVAGLLNHHYIPGTVIGVITLISLLSGSPSVAPSRPAPTALVAAGFTPTGAYGATFAPQAAYGAVAQQVAVPQQMSQPAQSAGPAPQWAADPSGRHQYRWWDGHRWTPHVSTNGVVATDQPG